MVVIEVFNHRANDIPFDIANLKPGLSYKAIVKAFNKMHPQIATVVNNAGLYNLQPSTIAQDNAEKVLNYIEDLNLERNIKFRPTRAGGLFFSWIIGDWRYDMECVKNGYIIYSFIKSDYQKASGCLLFDDFIPQFEKYLLML